MIKKLHEVKIGEIVVIKGDEYEVVRNFITDLEVTRYPKGLTPWKLSQIAGEGVGAQMNLIVKPAVQKPNLADDFKRQISQKALTEQLKAQVAKPSLADQLQSQLEAKVQAKQQQHPGFSSAHAFGYGEVFQPQIFKGRVKDDGILKGVVGSQARQITETKVSLGALSHRLDRELNAFGEEVGEAFETVDENFESVEEAFQDFNQEIVTLRERVSELEGQLEEHIEEGHDDDLFEDDSCDCEDCYPDYGDYQTYEEERVQMNLQQQLNQSIAQKKFDAAVATKNTKTNGGNTMKNLLAGFKNQFGKVEGQFALSPVGLAVRKNFGQNDFVAFNKATGEITDVANFTLDIKIPAFRLPVAAGQVEKGDIVVNEGKYGFAVNIADGYVEVVYPQTNSKGTIIPTTNLLLRQAFYTVVKTLDVAGATGFDPMLLMAMGNGDKKDILPFLLMSGGLGGAAGTSTIDPMMLAMLSDSTDEILPFILMQQGGALGKDINPLMLLAMTDKKEGKGGFDKLLPLMLMGQGGAGNIAQNPLLMMSLLGDGDIDPMTLMLMSGQGGLGNLFGQAPATTVAPKATDKK